MYTMPLLFFNGEAFLNWLSNGSGPVTACIFCGWITWVVRGYLTRHKNRVRKVKVKNKDLSEQIKKVDDRVTKVDERVTKLDERVTKLDEKFDARIRKVEENVAELRVEMVQTKHDLMNHIDKSILPILIHLKLHPASGAENKKSQE